MYGVILQGYLARCKQEYLLFHRFYVQNGPLRLFSLKFCISEVINVTKHFPVFIYSLVTTAQRKTKDNNENIFAQF